MVGCGVIRLIIINNYIYFSSSDAAKSNIIIKPAMHATLLATFQSDFALHIDSLRKVMGDGGQ